MKKIKNLVLMLMATMFAFNVNVNAEVSSNGGLDISKSKDATEFDSNDMSQVTLSVPSSEEQLVSDVVFVVDKSSCTKDATKEAISQMERLIKSIDSTQASINVGVVVFAGNAKATLELTPITESNVDTLSSYFVTPSGLLGGTNMEDGLLVAEEMLDASSTRSNRKYVVVISDGITRLYNGLDGEVKDIFYNANFEGNTFKYDGGTTPWMAVNGFEGYNTGADYRVPTGSFETYISNVKKLIEADGDTYAVNVKEYGAYGSNDDSVTYVDTFDKNEKGNYIITHALAMDHAIYNAYVAAQRIGGKYNIYGLAIYEGKSSYAIGNELLHSFNGGKSLSFDNIKNDIYYAVSSNSYIYDEMGNDVDFVNDTNLMTLTVGNDEYKPEVISENKYGFAKNEDGSYKYVITYDVESDSFVWEINCPVSNFEPVSFTYSVVLVNRPSNVGTSMIPTNNVATITPVDSDGKSDGEYEFPVPEVEYSMGSVTTTYVDEAGNEIADSNYELGKTGDEYTTISKDIEDYNLVKTPINANGNFTDKNIDVIYVYAHKTGNVIVNYIDEDGNELAMSFVFIGYTGVGYETKAKDIEDYNLVKVPSNATGTYTEEDIIVNYVYAHKTGDVTVNYVDQYGNKLDDSVVITGNTGSEYETEAKEFEGFVLVEVPSNATGIYDENGITVNYVYEYVMGTGNVEEEVEVIPPRTGNESNNIFNMIVVFVMMLLTKVFR